MPATPATTPDCTSRTHVTVIEQDVTLVGCQDWAAGETIHLTFKSEDRGTYEGLELFLASECSASSCTGRPIWKGDVSMRDPNSYTVDPIDPLPAGDYVLRDAVHPTTATLTIRVS